MPEAIEVRKVPIHSVADASRAGQAHRRRRDGGDRVIAIIGKTEGNGGVNDYTRIIADRAFREVLVEKGARPPSRSSRSRSCGPAAPTASSAPTPRSSRPCPTTKAEQTDEPRLTVGFAMSEQLQPEEIGHVAMVEQGRRRRQGRHGAGRHHRPGRRALRADQDPAADDPHDPRRQVARPEGLDRAHARVDGPLQRHDRPRHRRRARRDRDADRRRRHAQPLAVLLGRLLLARASSSTRRRSSSSATPAGSAAATASATR